VQKCAEKSCGMRGRHERSANRPMGGPISASASRRLLWFCRPAFACWGQHQAAPLLFRPPDSNDSVLGLQRVVRAYHPRRFHGCF